MDWTDKQREVIEARGCNILVSAAAGSGKTAVLVERIRRLIMGDGMDAPVGVDRLLVLTFTEAAASEMRQKIVASIEAALERQDDPALREQLRRIYSASISTFHAFALSLLKRYYYLIDGMEPVFNVCDEYRRSLLVGEALDALFKEEFASKNQQFLDFLRCYAGAKNEFTVREMMINTHTFIMSLPEPFKWLDEQPERLRAGKEAFLGSDAAGIMLGEIRCELGESAAIAMRLAELLDIAGVPSLSEKSRIDAVNLGSLIGKADAVSDASAVAAFDAFEALSAAVRNFKWERFVCKKADKEAYEMIREVVKSRLDRARKRLNTVKKRFFSSSLDAMVSDMADTAGSAETLCRLVREFDEIFTKLKRREGLIDFSDIEHMALKILEDPRVQVACREKYAHIFIDEYQDNNLVQECLIERMKRPDNLFMVGDIKQSIYKFRLAEPEIFIKKYETFQYARDTQASSEAVFTSSHDLAGWHSGKHPDAFKQKCDSAEAACLSGCELADGHPGRSGPESGSRMDLPFNRKIDLNRNFRSKGGLLSDINHIFRRLMSGPRSGVVYDEHAALYRGIDYDEEWERHSRLLLIDMETAAAEEDSLIAGLKAVELEAMAAARLIRETIDQGDTFFDAKIGAPRPYRLRDIVILLREVRSSGQIFYDALMNDGIPAFAESGDGYFDTVEIETFTNLLRVIDNLRQDIPLVSALYSVVFGFSTDELSRIRAAHLEGAFHDAFAHYIESGEDAELRAKCTDVQFRIIALRRREMFMELDEFLWELMHESGFYDYIGALPGGSRRQANLRALIDRATGFQSDRIRGLCGFIGYIDSIRERRVPMGQVGLVAEGEDVVRIMSIHKSKGLEFPMVILGQLDKKLQVAVSGAESRLSLHRQVGLALQWECPRKRLYRKTLLQHLNVWLKAREERAELIRVLYVALTRAMDRLILLGACSDAADRLDGAAALDAAADTDITQSRSYLEMLLPLLSGMDELRKTAVVVSAAEVFANGFVAGPPSGGRVPASDALLAHFESAEPGTGYAEVDRRLSWHYPFEGEALSIKSKYSVSELNRIAVENAAVRHIAAESATAGYIPAENTLAAHIAAESATPGYIPAENAVDVHIAAESATGCTASESAAAGYIPAENTLAAHIAAESAAAGCITIENETAEHRVKRRSPMYFMAGSEEETLEDAGQLGAAVEAERSDAAAEKGTALHRALEYLDYEEAYANRADKAYFRLHVSNLADQGILTSAQKALVAPNDLKTYANTEIFRRAAAAGTLRREVPFLLRKHDVPYLFGNSAAGCGDPIIVQGVIDCFFVEAERPDRAVLIDFKSGGYYDGLSRAHPAGGVSEGCFAKVSEGCLGASEGCPAGTPSGDICPSHNSIETLFTARYGEQINLYRDALEQILGLTVDEAYLYLTSAGKALKIQRRMPPSKG